MVVFEIVSIFKEIDNYIILDIFGERFLCEKSTDINEILQVEEEIMSIEFFEEKIVVISINKNIIADENIRVKNGVQIVICNTDPYFEIILDFFLKDINKYYDFYHIKYKSLYN